MAKAPDLTGQKFGKLTVISREFNTASKGSVWLCRCECGVERTAPASNLKNGQANSCKNCRKNISRKDLTGLKFNRWTVVGFSHKDPWRTAIWDCKCDCGTEAKVLGHHLTKNKTISCGCFMSDFTHNLETGRLNEPGKSGFNTLLARYKRSAKEYDRLFELTNEEFYKITQSDCFYCGIEPYAISNGYYSNEELKKHASYTYNGLDRVDTSKHYTLDNVVPSCKPCNYAKNNMSYTDFIIYLDRVTDFRLFQRRLNQNPLKRLTDSASSIKSLDLLLSSL